MTNEQKERLKIWVQDAVIYSIGHRCLDRERKKKHKENLEILLALIDRVPSEGEAKITWDTMQEWYSEFCNFCLSGEPRGQDMLSKLTIRKALGVEEQPDDDT